MQPKGLPDYHYRGAAASVALHEAHLREFMDTWDRARERCIALPKTGDPAYRSLEALLFHVLGCARGYMVWCCQKLGVDDPAIDPAPDVEVIAEGAESFLRHLIDRWRLPLATVTEDRFYVVHESPWGVGYCVDAMLEHAVMHPIRHTHQLEALLADQ